MKKVFPVTRRGFSLVIVLALVVLVTIAVVAFFSSVTANHQIESSRSDHTQAELLSRTAGEYVSGLFLDEIRSPGNSAVSDTGGISLYTPLSNTNAIPARRLPAAISPTEPVFANLVRQSAQPDETKASAHSTADPARNNRSINVDRWNAPRLLSGAGFANTTQIPNWIYVTRDTGVTATPSPQAIGRFAYNVYDLGNLLNINVAGYPDSLGAADVSRLKGFLAGADLRELGLTQTDVNALLAFRNPNTIASATDYSNAVYDAARSGFLSIVTRNLGAPRFHNYFSSRQDLIRYATLKNNALGSALPLLTHFSRAVTAPSWTPPTITSSNPSVTGIRFSAPATIMHYRDDGSKEDPITFQSAEPLVQRRFSLAKLAWIGPSGPKASAFVSGLDSAEQEEAIRRCFGLRWNDGADRWDYYGSDGSASLQSRIFTLAEVAQRNREPNFFELLKAGMLEGSLGTTAAVQTMAGANAQMLEANKDYQVLRIGAAIIDQADPDNFPTILSFDGDLEAAGIEDLPYFHEVCMSALRQTNTATNRLTALDFVWAPVFFNPHQPSSPSTGPDRIEANISRGLLTGVEANSHYELEQSLAKDLSVLSPLAILAADFESFRASPQPSRDSASAARLGTVVPYAATGADRDAQVFHLFSYQTEYSAEPWPAKRPDSDNAIFGAFTSDLIIRLQYRNAKGNLKTYATFAGHEAVPDSGWNGVPRPPAPPGTYFGPSFTSPARLQQSDFSLSYYASLWDPRTNRLGPSRGLFHPLGAPPALTGSGDKTRDGTPFATGDLGAANPIHPALWAQGGKSRDAAGMYSNFADPDGQFRPADGWLGDDANLFRDLSASGNERRPCILQRPFQSVAELGCVFRDTPWKTLSFFDESSADAGLLDLFSVVDEPAVSAGRVNLNTRQPQVQEALLSGAGQNPAGTEPLGNSTAVAASLQSYSFSSGLPRSSLIHNPADLAAFMSPGNLPPGIDLNKARREAVVRALASSGQTRTWNLLIDVIAQSGRFPGTSNGAADFVIEGEKRYWLSIAIDRYSGEVVDRQWEVVYE